MLVEAVQSEGSSLREEEVTEQLQPEDPLVPELEPLEAERPTELVQLPLRQPEKPQRTGHLPPRTAPPQEEFEVVHEQLHCSVRQEIQPWADRLEDGQQVERPVCLSEQRLPHPAHLVQERDSQQEVERLSPEALPAAQLV